jgi:hypothetical protein
VESLIKYIRKTLNEAFVDDNEEFLNEVNESLDESKRPVRKVAGALIKDEESGEVLLIKRNDKTPLLFGLFCLSNSLRISLAGNNSLLYNTELYNYYIFHLLY